MFSGRVALIWLVGGAFIASGPSVHAQGRLPVASGATSHVPAKLGAPVTHILPAGGVRSDTGPLKKDGEKGKAEESHKEHKDKTKDGELELLALQNNPTLVQAAMQLEASRAKAIQAKLWPNPTIGYVQLVKADLERSLADMRRMELSLQKRLASEFEIDPQSR